MRDRVGGRRREERITCSLFSPTSLPFYPVSSDSKGIHYFKIRKRGGCAER